MFSFAAMSRTDKFVRKLPPRLLLCLPVLLYLSVALFWQSRGFYHITGDEVHYLLISESLVRDGDVLAANNYRADTEVGRASGVKPSDPPHLAHLHDQFSRHNIGLPFIIAVPYLVAGIFGAKIFMALLAGLWPLLLYRTLFRITESRHWSALVAFTLALGLPFAAASNQIFPDLLGGMIILFVTEKIFALHGEEDERPQATTAHLWVGFLLGFLPWLHIRLAAPALILLLGYVAANKVRSPGHADGPARRPGFVASAIVACSLILLGVYNHTAFGNPFGPYESGDLSFQAKQVAMIFLGLHWDQSQGMFMQQPLLVMGLVGIAPLVRANRRGAFLLAALYLSILIPNSMHTAWYGGFSFFGRFWWSAAALWIFPLAYAVKFLLKRSRVSLFLLAGAGIILQGVFAARWVFHNGFLLNSDLPIWAARSFYHATGFSLRLPVFRDFDFYLKHPANYVFATMGLLLVVTGWLLLKRVAHFSTARMWAVALVLGGSLFLLAPPALSPLTITANDLRAQVGTLEGTSRVATESDGAGTLVYGPYLGLTAGDYELALRYESDNPAGAPSSRYDIVYGPVLKLLAGEELPPSAANDGLIKHRFTVREDQSLDAPFEFRVHYGGRGTLKVKRLTITPLALD
jgi:hypothetical protein